VTDAIDMLKDHVEKHSKAMKGSGDGYVLGHMCAKLVSACCVNNDVAQAIELTSLLFDGGFVKPGTFHILETVVDEYLKK